MNKRNIIIVSIIAAIVLLLLIIITQIYHPSGKNDKNDNKNQVVSDDKNGYTYDYAVKISNKLYKTDNNVVEVTEEDKEYVILVKNKDNNEVMNKFKLNKKTGVISEEAQSATNESTGN